MKEYVKPSLEIKSLISNETLASTVLGQEVLVSAPRSWTGFDLNN